MYDVWKFNLTWSQVIDNKYGTYTQLGGELIITEVQMFDLQQQMRAVDIGNHKLVDLPGSLLTQICP